MLLSLRMDRTDARMYLVDGHAARYWNGIGRKERPDLGKPEADETSGVAGSVHHLHTYAVQIQEISVLQYLVDMDRSCNQGFEAGNGALPLLQVHILYPGLF
jgi:hypothetical protein